MADILDEYNQYKQSTTAPPVAADSSQKMFDEYNQFKQAQGDTSQSLPGGVVPNAAPAAPQGFSTPANRLYNQIPAYQSMVPPKEQARVQQQQQTTQQQNQDVANQTQQALGAKYEPQGITDVERTKLGMAPNFAETVNSFKQMYPEGKIDNVQGPNGEYFIRYQKSPKDTPALLSPGSVKAWNEWNQMLDPNTDPATRANKFADAVARTVEDNPREAVKSIVLGMVTGGEGFLINASRIAPAIGATNYALNAPYTGMVSNETAKKTAVDSATDGLLALFGYGAGAGANLTTAYARGRGLMPLTEEGRQALQDLVKLKDLGKSQGMPEDQLNQMNLLPQQVASSKLVSLYAGIASRLLNQLPEYVKNQKSVATKVMRGMYDTGDVEATMQAPNSFSSERTGRLPTALEAQKSAWEVNGPVVPNKTFSEAASNINSKLASYADRSKSQTVDPAYAHARSIEEPQYDPSPAIDAAARAEKGVSTLSNYEKKPIFGTDVDAQGNPIQSYTAINKETSPVKTATPALQDVINKVKLWQSQPPMPVARTLSNGEIVTDSVTDQVNALRQKTFDLSQKGPAGETRGDEALASQVYDGLTKMIENTKNINPQFQDAWKNASAEARKRFENLENPLLRRGYKQEEEEAISPGSTSAKTVSGQVENLQQFEKWSREGVIAPEDYKGLLEARKTQLFQKPDTLKDTLDAMPSDLKTQLFPNKAELQLYKNYGDAYKTLKTGGIEPAMQQNSTAYGLIDTLFSGNELSTAQLDTLAKTAPSSELGKSLRAATLDKLYSTSVNLERGNPMMGADTLASQLQNMDRGARITKFLEPEDMDNLNRLVRYFQTNKIGEKSLGASIAAYSEATKLREMEKEAVFSLLESYGVGKLFTSKFGQKIFYGDPTLGAQPGTLLKKLGTAMSQQAGSKKIQGAP